MKSFKKYLDAKTKTPEAIAKKHGVGIALIMTQLKKGIDVEKEHSSDPKIAREIALDHIAEDPRYYTKLIKMEGGKH